MLAPNNLSEFLTILDNQKEIKRISEEVDPYLEITALTEPIMKTEGPALLFEKVKNSSTPLVINLFGNRKRICIALGVNDLDEITTRLKDFMKINFPQGFWAKLATAIPKLKNLTAFIPKQISNAPCQEIVLNKKQASLDILPILTCWPEDAGPFITLPQVITADPKTGKQNQGMYRLQKFDTHTTAIHWHLHKGGTKHYYTARELKQKLPVAIVLGGPPAAIYTACAPLPEYLDEAILAGFLLERSLKVVKAISSNLLVPAEAEVVLEGYVDPMESWRVEGPFGDHTGYYSLANEYPIFHLTTMSYRKNFIYPSTIVGKPPMEDYWLGMATERIFLPLLQSILPEVVDYHMPAEGVFHNLVFVSIKKQYPGHAFKVMNALWGQGQMMFAKVIVIVDAEVNVQNEKEVWWETLNHIDPQRDIIFTKGPADTLDHAARLPHLHSKMGIDGTKKWYDEGFNRPWPNRIVMTTEVQQIANEKLKRWGLISKRTKNDQ